MSGSIVTSCLFATLISDVSMNAQFIIGTGIVLFATTCYSAASIFKREVGVGAGVGVGVRVDGPTEKTS